MKRVIADVIRQYAIPIYSEEFLSEPKNYETIDFTINVGLFYETLLMMIRGETVRFSKQKARRLRLKEHEILMDINRRQELFNTNKSENNLRLLEDAKHSLESVRKSKINGLITRSRVQWFEEGEKCTKYFLSLEKRNAVRNKIQSLKIDNEVITDNKQIIQYFSDNLQTKYRAKSSNTDIKNYLQNHVERKVSQEQRNALEMSLTLHELHTALLSMKKGKTPGANGFTSGFFKQFWDFLGIFLYRATMEGLQSERSLPSHRESVVTLIPKQGKPSDSLKGWRPISLLNVDFKIVSTAIANRLKSVLSDIISSTQTAYIPGRFIGENTRLMYDVIEHVNNTGASGCMMAIDFEAAFDTVSWQFLGEALRYYNFGPMYTRMLKTYYLCSDNFSRIVLDGNLGPKIYMERGIRQGDPISGHLFNLVMEPLASQLLKSKLIQGIPLSHELEARVSQYADDLIVFSQLRQTSMGAVMTELRRFTEVSGLRVNIDKTKCLPIGRHGDSRCIGNLGLSMVNEVKVLGIVYAGSNRDIETKNVNLIMPKISKEIIQWKRRNLTIIGKITVVKALLISKLVHIFTSLPDPPEHIIKQINTILFAFIWNSKPDKIKRNKLVQNYDSGGLRMVEVSAFIKSLKASWLKRLYWSKANLTWADYVKSMWPPIEKLICFGSDRLNDESRKGDFKNRFWNDVLGSWAYFCASVKLEPSQLLTETLWFSDHTKYRTSIVKAWDEKGLRFIADLYDKNTGLLRDCNALRSTFKVKLTFLCHSSLVKSIQGTLPDQSQAKNVMLPIIPYKVTLLAQRCNISQKVYNVLVKNKNKKKSQTTSTESKWMRDIGTLGELSIREVRTATRSTYLQAFHYRLTNRIIATNTFLHRIGVSESPLCSFCKSENETLIHILWECTTTQRYIKEIAAQLRLKFNTSFVFTAKSWVFPCSLKAGALFTLITTIGKLVIFKAKYNEEIPNFHHFLSLLKIEARNEELFAIKTKTKDSFLHKWKNMSKVASGE